MGGVGKDIQNGAETGAGGKALIAMSGGVDSSVAALLAQRAGYTCAGATLLLLSDEDDAGAAGTAGAAGKEDRSCFAQSDARDAARVAAALGIPHYVFDFSREFRDKVIYRFADAYTAGATPNPCIDCNNYLKFGLLLERARQMGFDMLVTGHYARITRGPGLGRERGADDEDGMAGDGGPGLYSLSRAACREKDQTYFLYSLTQDQLACVLFPLADLTKPQVRALAAEAALPTAEKRESQDICFVRGGDYAAFLERYGGGPDASGMRNGFMPGSFVDDDGRVLGRHGGIARYTIGQRKGIGVALGKPAFVSEIRAESNEVVLSTDEGSLLRDSIEVGDVNWICGERPAGPVRAEVQVRYAAEPAPATISLVGGNTGRGNEADSMQGRAVLIPADEASTDVLVRFDKPVRAPARGQAAVFYDGDVVLGGGRIV